MDGKEKQQNEGKRKRDGKQHVADTGKPPQRKEKLFWKTGDPDFKTLPDEKGLRKNWEERTKKAHEEGLNNWYKMGIEGYEKDMDCLTDLYSNGCVKDENIDWLRAEMLKLGPDREKLHQLVLDLQAKKLEFIVNSPLNNPKYLQDVQKQREDILKEYGSLKLSLLKSRMEKEALTDFLKSSPKADFPIINELKATLETTRDDIVELEEESSNLHADINWFHANPNPKVGDFFWMVKNQNWRQHCLNKQLKELNKRLCKFNLFISTIQKAANDALLKDLDSSNYILDDLQRLVNNQQGCQGGLRQPSTSQLAVTGATSLQNEPSTSYQGGVEHQGLGQPSTSQPAVTGATSLRNDQPVTGDTGYQNQPVTGATGQGGLKVQSQGQGGLGQPSTSQPAVTGATSLRNDQPVTGATGYQNQPVTGATGQGGLEVQSLPNQPLTCNTLYMPPLQYMQQSLMPRVDQSGYIQPPPQYALQQQQIMPSSGLLQPNYPPPAGLSMLPGPSMLPVYWPFHAPSTGSATMMPRVDQFGYIQPPPQLQQQQIMPSGNSLQQMYPLPGYSGFTVSVPLQPQFLQQQPPLQQQPLQQQQQQPLQQQPRQVPGSDA